MVKNSAGRWFFSTAPTGSFEGFNDASEEFFKDNYWDKAVRELLQNSVDAAASPEGTVFVTMTLKVIPTELINAHDLIPHFREARDAEAGNKKARKHYDRALEMLGGGEIDVLEVTDSNTMGLSDGKWEALVFKSGVTDKGGRASGGSFGIGKNAPYVASDLKTVLYYTTYPDGGGRAERFVGKCKLVTHRDPSGGRGDLHNVGFLTRSGDPKGRGLAAEGDEIPDAFRIRNRGGSTTIFIAGFRRQRGDWKSRTAHAIARNFFMAVMENKLHVRICEGGDERVVSAETLGGIIKAGRDKDLQAYYRIAMDGEPRVIEGRFGRFELRFLTEGEDLPRRTAYINRKGMFITDGRRFNTNPFSPGPEVYAQYGALIRAADDDTDARIREMEPPSHDGISCEKIDDGDGKDEIKRQLKEVQGSIRDVINGAMGPAPSTTVNIDELASSIPMIKNRTYSLSKKPLSPGSPGRDADIIPGEDDIPEKPKGPEKPGPGPGTTRPPRRTTPGGRKPKRSSILASSSVKRNDGRLRVWLSLNDAVDPLKFLVFPAGEQAVGGEDCLAPRNVRPVEPYNMEVGVDGSTVIVRSPPRDIALDLDVGGLQEYSGYNVRAIRERPKKSNIEEAAS